MIHIFGQDNTSEYEAALQLRGLILDALPKIKNSQQDVIVIIAGAQCHGQKVRDIDLL